jgi:hypothetical protein
MPFSMPINRAHAVAEAVPVNPGQTNHVYASGIAKQQSAFPPLSLYACQQDTRFIPLLTPPYACRRQSPVGNVKAMRVPSPVVLSSSNVPPT